MTTQDTINADVATLTDALSEFSDGIAALQTEIANLKEQVPAEVDTTALDNIVTQLKSAADAVKPAPVESTPSVDTPPADTTPVDSTPPADTAPVDTAPVTEPPADTPTNVSTAG